MYNTKSKTFNLTYRLDLVKVLILTHRPQIPSPVELRWLSINPSPGRLRGKHFTGNISDTSIKAKFQRKYAVFTFQKKRRKETIHCCPECQVGLCFQ
jgi:hypothetical protein